jgi:hypothetical protein
MENVYEQFFHLKYRGGWSFIEAYNLPILLRRWFVERLNRQLQEENEEAEKAKNKAKRGGIKKPSVPKQN